MRPGRLVRAHRIVSDLVRADKMGLPHQLAIAVQKHRICYGKGFELYGKAYPSFES